MAVGHDYQAKLVQHQSQTDAAKGFGGKYGVQKDRQDKSAVDWSHKEKLQQHASQTGVSSFLLNQGSHMTFSVYRVHFILHP